VDSSIHKSYRVGLYFLIGLVGGILFIWCFFLLWLKLNSDAVGCAAGKRFDNKRMKQKVTRKNKTPESYQETDNTKRNLNDTIPGRCSTSHSSEIGMTVSMNNPSSIDTQDESCSVNNHTPNTGRRARRTRICFFIFGLTILCIVPLTMVYSYKPFVKAKEESEPYLDDTRGIVHELKLSIPAILSASSSSIDLITNTTYNAHTICPKSTAEELKDGLGLNISGMIAAFNMTHKRLTKYNITNTTDISRITSFLDKTVTVVESTYDEADNYFWILPSFLILLGAVTCTALFGAALAWRRTSTQQLQFLLSYVFLPVLIASSIGCWMIAGALAVVTAVSHDACMPENLLQQPNETLAEILELSGILKNSSLHKMVDSYTGECYGEDSTKPIVDIVNQVEAISGAIWKYLSSIDAVGDSNLEIFCGSQSELQNFLSASRELAQYLTNVKDGLESAIKALSCERVSRIYVAFVQRNACSDAADAVAWGFIFFIVFAFSTMVLISLRSSWLHDVQEERIYDESEVDENMIVDEHEEYLAYISKYKHEWDEYQGLDTEIAKGGNTTVPEVDIVQKVEPTVSECVSISDTSHIDSQSGRWTEHDTSISQDQNSSQGCFDLSSVATHENFDPYRGNDSQSQCTGVSSEISFLSLTESGDTKEMSSFKKFARMLPPLLVPHASFDGGDDEEVTLPHPSEDHTRDNFSPVSFDTESTLNFQEDAGNTNVIDRNQNQNNSQLRRLPSLNSIGFDQRNKQDVTTKIGTDQANQGDDKDDGTPNINNMRRGASKSVQGDFSTTRVHFLVEENEPHPSMVKQHVVKFTKVAQASPNRPATPQRQQALRMKQLAARFDGR
jgi:hypothetical protein